MISNPRHGSPPRLMAHQPTRFATAQESTPSPSPGPRITGSPLLRPVRLLASLDGSDRVSPATGGFYIQASGGSVTLPVAGYDYNSTGLLCWRDFHPQEWQLASLHQTLAVMPKDLNQIPAPAPKDKKMTRVRITPECFLHQQGQAIEALAHVRTAGGQPDPDTARDRDHRRPARMPSTATMVAGSTGPAIRTRPPAHSTSTTPPTPSSGGRGVSTGEGSTSGTKAGSGGRSADCSCCRRSRRHRNRRLGVIPCRRATEEIELVVRRASSTMARFSQAAQDRRVLATTVCAKALGPDMSTIQVYPTDPYRSHPHPSPIRRPRPAFNYPHFQEG